MKSVTACFTLLILASLVGCKSNSTGPTTLPVVIPHAGSSYTFAEIYVDSTGTLLRRDTMTMRIVADSVSHGGYNDVKEIFESRSVGMLTATDTLYYRFLAIGDVMVDYSSTDGGFANPAYTWVTLPFTSHKDQSVALDTMIASGSTNLSDTLSCASHYASSESLVLLGQALAMEVITFNYTINSASSLQGASSERLSEITTYSPTSGVFGGQSVTSETVQGGTPALQTQTLIAFTVK